MSADHRTGLRPSTRVVSLGRPPHEDDAAVNPPITLSSTYVGTGAVASGSRGYCRYSNPTWDPFEEALADLEGAQVPGLLYG